MNWKKIFKKDPVAYKQPQEYYCSNYDCLNEVAALCDLSNLLDENGLKQSTNYCIDCIVERKTA